jgi:MFS family permease
MPMPALCGMAIFVGSPGEREWSVNTETPYSVASIKGRKALSRHKALRFIVLLGIVSLFADMTYEGARSIVGPYLVLLGASATVVGVVAGFGELVGYALRFVSGRIADRTGRYWLVTIFGYVLNLVAVPLLALAGHWQVAVLLMFLERTGKALRSPPRDAMLSFAGRSMGRGWGFALHEAMDQVGATIGPLLMAGVMLWKNGNQMSAFQIGFALLLVPAVLALGTLALARMQFPDPRAMERCAPVLETRGQAIPFWLYVAAMACLAAGFADYPLIAYHFQASGVVVSCWIPFLYAVAMAVDAVTALIFGTLHDRKGMVVIVVAMLASLPAAALSLGDRRGSAFGVYNMTFGIFWFAGSALMGVLYDISIQALVVFSVGVQLAGVPLMMLVARRYK